MFGDKFELEIYNKKEESNNIHNKNIRVEFRYKRLERLNKNVYDNNTYILKTIDKIKGMDAHLEHLEDNMTERLLKLYEAKKEELMSFSEFVRRYNEYFYTLNILKNVYMKVGLKGSYSKWLEKFRKSNKLTFYTKSDIRTIQKAMIKSAKEYLKVDKDTEVVPVVSEETDILKELAVL